MLPVNCSYQGKKESAAGRRYRTNIQPQSGSSFTAGQTITINIPTRANTLLIPSESTLNVGIQFTNSSAGTAVANARWESCGAHSIVSRIRTYHGSNLLEDIDAYGVLAKVLMDYVAPEDFIKGKGSMMIGTRQDYAVTAGTTVQSVNTGAFIDEDGAIAASSSSTLTYYNLNLISILGSLSATKYLPLFAMTAA